MKEEGGRDVWAGVSQWECVCCRENYFHKPPSTHTEGEPRDTKREGKKGGSERPPSSNNNIISLTIKTRGRGGVAERQSRLEEGGGWQKEEEEKGDRF